MPKNLERRIRETARAVKAWTGESFTDLGSGCGWSTVTAKRKLNAGTNSTKGATLSLADVERLCAHWEVTPADLMAGFDALEEAGRLPYRVRALVERGEPIPRAYW